MQRLAPVSELVRETGTWYRVPEMPCPSRTLPADFPSPLNRQRRLCVEFDWHLWNQGNLLCEKPWPGLLEVVELRENQPLRDQATGGGMWW